ncbi:DUF3820 family protein [Maribacter sp. 2307ULW6-5]|uniref:DUF3820 family protein n=1 Tax=Maribacter sp. 2307ULW6-5 TaxID=3386275 RepID=UPI0039BCE169
MASRRVMAHFSGGDVRLDAKDRFFLITMKIEPNKQHLIELAHYRMPFGKYKGKYLLYLPEAYLVWFQRQGFPEGKLGFMLRSMLEIKVNELEALLRTIQKDFPR